MTLNLDVGIDIGGCMHPFLLKGEILPYTHELKIAPMNEQTEVEVGFYEGPRALVKDNQLLGKILLKHEKEIGPFVLTISISLDLKMNVSIEGNLLETFHCSNECTAFFILKEADPYITQDNIFREREKERLSYKEYIYQALFTLKQIDDKYDKTVILDLLHKSEDVAYMEDVTLEELKLAQQETEHNVNTFMNTIVKNGYVL
jgi:molecular chaperone DnaK (HSP70)